MDHKTFYNDELLQEISDSESSQSDSLKSTDRFQPVKLKFLRKFSSTSGKISRNDLEELLLQKIIEALMYKSKFSKINESLFDYEEQIKRLKDRIKLLEKQYNDLAWTHSKIVQSLRENPQVPIEPVKIVRNVSCQVYQSMPETIEILESPRKTPEKEGTEATTDVPAKISGENSNCDSLKDVEKKGQKRNATTASELGNKTPKGNSQNLDIISRHVENIQDDTLVPERSKNVPDFNLNSQKSTIETEVPISFKVPITNDSERQEGSATTGLASSESNHIKGEKVSSKRSRPGPLCSKSKSKVSKTKTSQLPLESSFSDLMNLSTYSMFSPSTNLVTSTPRKSVIVQNSQFKLPPLPPRGLQLLHPKLKEIPPAPTLKVTKVNNGIRITWNICELKLPKYADIQNYQIYVYEQSTSETDSWKLVGDVKALLLPMAVTLKEFSDDQRFHFTVRAVDVHNRFGEFSSPETWE